MSYNAFERAASRYPNLADAILRIGEKLIELDVREGSGALRPDDFAAATGIDANQISSAFRVLCDDGVMSSSLMHECKSCETLMGEDELTDEDGECSGCGRRTSFAQSLIYRLVLPDSVMRQTTRNPGSPARVPMMKAAGHTASGRALELWREKLSFLQERLAIEADPAQTFQLKHLIEEAKGEIASLVAFGDP